MGPRIFVNYYQQLGFKFTLTLQLAHNNNLPQTHNICTLRMVITLTWELLHSLVKFQIWIVSKSAMNKCNLNTFLFNIFLSVVGKILSLTTRQVVSWLDDSTLLSFDGFYVNDQIGYNIVLNGVWSKNRRLTCYAMRAPLLH